MLEEKLEAMGLTNGEAKVYRSLLNSGPSTVGPIIKNAGIAHSNIYEILDRLIQKGLVSYIVKEKTKYFQTTTPNRLLDFIEDQEKKIKESRDNFNKLLPTFNRMAKESGIKEAAEIFIGTRGLVTAYEVLLEELIENEIGRYFYIHEGRYIEQAYKVYSKILPILRKAKVRWRGVCSYEYRNTELSLMYKGLVKNKYVRFPLPGNIDIYSDKVIIVSWGEKPIAVLIRSKEVANNLKSYFDAMWKM